MDLRELERKPFTMSHCRGTLARSIAALVLALALPACGDDDGNNGPEPDARPPVDAPPAVGDAPYKVDLFVRGSFNDWGAAGKEVPFVYQGNDRYTAYSRMPVGLHLFKIADADWSPETTFSAHATEVLTLALGEPTPLTSAPGDGNHSNLPIGELAAYELELSVVDGNTAAPVLVVKRDPEPYDVTLYVRGSFNDWGSENNELPLVYHGNGQYRIAIELEAGTHEFKIADKDWTPQTTFSASSEEEVQIALDAETALVTTTEQGKSTVIEVAEAGAYTFRLVAKGDPGTPRLLVTPARPGEPVTINPHRNAIAMATLAGLPGSNTQAVISIDEDSATRTYALSTTQTLRQANVPSYVKFSERPDSMSVRSGNLMFDGLFAMALDEARLNSVSKIEDGSFETVDCECFETGELWHFVWTRDISYAVDLALAMVDPARARNSLAFKTGSKRLDIDNPHVGAGAEIVQDTGSGGSWPVSSDRVVWAQGAWELLKYLDGSARQEFLDVAYEVITSTIHTDRSALYDSRDGLYRGEQSFLDWREQTYPSWVARDVVHIAMAKSLSTNVAHYAILSIAAQLAAEKGDAVAQATYQAHADALKAAINESFWLDDAQLYSSLKHTELDPAVLEKFELLGQALAILHGVADVDQASRILTRYPHSRAGAPVIWPQQPDVPIYHNRAIWPFVTAYTLRAARLAKNDAVIEHNIESLMRGAALNLSNMENLEFSTGQPGLFDPTRPELFGPVLNSRRQLWSVAGYLSMVLDVTFGREASQQGIRFLPFITRNMRATLFAGTSAIELRNLPYKGKRIDVRVELPPVPAQTGGYYDVATITLNGTEIDGGFIPAEALQSSNTLVITLADGNTSDAAMTVVEVANPLDVAAQAVFAPREPRLLTIEDGNGEIALSFDSNGESGTVFNVYRNGDLVASNLASTSWVDDTVVELGSNTYCYAVEQVFTSSGNASHHSPPRCVVGAKDELEAGMALTSLDGATTTTMDGTTYFADWGTPSQALEVAGYTPAQSGEYLVSLRYNNTLAHVSTGITATVKWVEVTEAGTGEAVASGVLVMPQVPDDAFAGSSYLPARLDAGTEYRVAVSDFFNMSYLDFFTIYRGVGGASGINNRSDVAALEVLRIGP